MAGSRFVKIGRGIRVVFREFRSGEIFSLVKRMNRSMGNRKIINVYRSFTLPDTVAGIVRLETKRYRSNYVPFKGENLIQDINGLKVKECSHLEPMPDGSLAGAIGVEDTGQVLVKADTVMESIEGMRIREVYDFFVLPSLLIAGNLETRSFYDKPDEGIWCAFKENSLIRRIGNREVESTYIYGVWSDGTLVGTALLKDKRRVPFKGDTLLDEVCGRRIMSVSSDSLDFPPLDGHLMMEVKLEDGRHAILKDDTLIETVQGKRLLNLNVTPELYMLSDGSLAGTVEVEDYEVYLFKDDTLIDRIGGKRVMSPSLRVVLPGDVLAGDVALGDGRRVPFVGDALIEEAGNRRIMRSKMLFALPNGNPVSLVKLEDGRELLLNGNNLVESIGSRRMVGVERPIYFLPDGKLVGVARLEDGREVPFKGEALLERVRGEGVVSRSVDSPLPDDTVNGRIMLEDGREFYFFWYEDEVYLSFPVE